MEAPATSMDEYKETSFVKNRTPIANPRAERIASISPKVIMIDGIVTIVCMLVPSRTFASLATAIKNPINARIIPITWILSNFSSKKIRAKTTIITISSGPAIRTSFEAPILLIESYHANIPTASEEQDRMRFFDDFENMETIARLLLKNAAINNNRLPANVILIAESTIGGICRNLVVKNSIRIDSNDMVIAYTKTTHDLCINNDK